MSSPKNRSCPVLKRISYRPREYDSEDGPWDPISGVASALLGTIGSLMMGVADFPVEFLRALKITPAGHSNNVGQVHSSANSTSMALTSASSVHSGSSTASLAESTSRAAETMRNPSGIVTAQPNDAGITAEPQTLLRGRDSGQNPTLSPSSTSEHRSMLGKAMRRSSSRSRSPSHDSRTSSQGPTPNSPHTEHEGNQMSLESALYTGKGVGRIVGVGLKSPMDITMSLARGFHNAPKLYGDESVRQTDKVTGIQSGLKAAGKVSILSRERTPANV